MQSGARRVEGMLKSIEKIGKDFVDGDRVNRTKEATEKLRESKKKFSDILSSSYNEAFDINK